MVTRLLLADDDLLFVAGLVDLLREDERWLWQGVYRDQTALEKAMTDSPTAVVLISVTLLQDAARLAALARAAQHRLVLVLRSGMEPPWRLLSEFRGVLHESLPEATLLAALATVAEGDTWSGPRAHALQEPETAGKRVLSQLSDRQLRVMSEVSRGEKNAAIASRLGTSEQVVKNMLRDIYDLTGVSDRLELALFVLHHPELAAIAEKVESQPAARR